MSLLPPAFDMDRNDKPQPLGKPVPNTGAKIEALLPDYGALKDLEEHLKTLFLEKYHDFFKQLKESKKVIPQVFDPFNHRRHVFRVEVRPKEEPTISDLPELYKLESYQLKGSVAGEPEHQLKSECLEYRSITQDVANPFREL